MIDESTDPNIIWRHGLQVVLKGLPPFDGGLELVHFNQVVCNKHAKNKDKTKDQSSLRPRSHQYKKQVQRLH